MMVQLPGYQELTLDLTRLQNVCITKGSSTGPR